MGQGAAARMRFSISLTFSFVLAHAVHAFADEPKSVCRLVGHTQPVSSIAFSWDSRRVATASYDGTARIWDAATGEERLTFAGHTRTGTSALHAVAFSPDGNRVASGGYGVMVWNANSAEEYFSLKDVGHVVRVAFSPDNKYLATGGHEGAMLWSSKNGEHERTLQRDRKGDNWYVAFSPDSKTLGMVGPVGLEIRGVRWGRRWWWGRGAWDVAFSPDGSRVATCGQQVTVWDIEAWDEHLRLPVRGVRSVLFTPNGRYIVTGNVDSVCVWDAESGRLLSSINERSAPPRPIALSPNGKLLAVGTANAVAIWNLDSLLKANGQLNADR